MMDTTAVLVTSAGTQPTLATITLADLREDEVLVRVHATGICHTDLAWARGQLDRPIPVVLGHETSGVVAEIGAHARGVSVGDRVVIALTHHCGRCIACETGHSMLCVERERNRPRLTHNGQPVFQGFGVGGFADYIIVRDSSCIPVPDQVPLSVACIVGCAVATGLGAVSTIAQVTTGARVLVVGAGGIGAAVILGAQLAGAEAIVAIDPEPARAAWALALGATAATAPDDPILAELTGDGFDFVFESAGTTHAMADAVARTRPGGTTTLIGAPSPDVSLPIPALDFVTSQKRLLGCLTGDVRPVSDFDRYFRLYIRGRLNLDALISHTVPMDQVPQALAGGLPASPGRVVAVTEHADQPPC